MAPKVQVTISAKDVASKEIKKVSSSLKNLKTNTSISNIFMKNLSSTMNNINKNSLKLVKNVGKFGAAGAIAGLGVVIGGLTKSIKEGSSIEMYSKQFEVLTGNVTLAQATISNLRNFAAKTPLSFSDLTDVSVQLMGAGVKSDELMNKLKMLGDVSMGNSDKLQSMANAYSKVKSTGKASLEYLNIFMERGVPIVQEMAKNYNITTKEMFKMISAGKVGLPEVEGALKSLTSEGGLFNNMMEKTSETLTGKISTFKDNITAAFADFGNKILPDVKVALDSISTSFTNLLINKEFNNFVSKAVKFSSWLFQQLAALPLYFNFIKNVFKIVIDEAIMEFNQLKETLKKVPVINFFIEVIGDTFDALKKGFKNGDWSDLLGVSSDIITAGLGIGLTIVGTKTAVSLMKPILYDALLKSGFTGASAGVTAFAGLAIGLKLISDVKEGNYKQLAANLVTAIFAGFIAQSFIPIPGAGVVTASLVFNLEIGTKIGDFVKNIRNKIQDAFGGDVSSIIIDSGLDLSKEEKDNDRLTAYNFKNSDKYNYLDIKNNPILTREQLAKKYLEATNIGKYMLDGLEIGLDDDIAIQKLVEKNAMTIINTVENVLGIASPSKKMKWVGQMVNQGLVVGLSDFSNVEKQMNNVGVGSLAAINKALGVHSPSSETKWTGQMLLEGLLQGIGDGQLKEKIQTEFKTLMDGLSNLGKVDVDATVNSIVNTESSDDDSNTKNSKPSIFNKMKSGAAGFLNKTSLNSLVSFKENLDSSGKALGTYTALLNYGNIIFDGIMSILGPSIDQVLKPVFGILNVAGQFLGKLLLPVFEMLGTVTEKLAEGFVWLYNKVLRPVGNGIITAMNFLANGIIGIVNGVISAINLIPFVNIEKLAYRTLDSGYLSNISLDSVNQAGSQYTGASGTSSSSSTSQQSYNINIYQTIEGNVIGEGGLSSLGAFLTQALEAYVGAGGKITFIKA